jgi:hypothetical protein
VVPVRSIVGYPSCVLHAVKHINTAAAASFNSHLTESPEASLQGDRISKYISQHLILHSGL